MYDATCSTTTAIFVADPGFHWGDLKPDVNIIVCQLCEAKQSKKSGPCAVAALGPALGS